MRMERATENKNTTDLPVPVTYSLIFPFTDLTDRVFKDERHLIEMAFYVLYHTRVCEAIASMFH